VGNLCVRLTRDGNTQVAAHRTGEDALTIASPGLGDDILVPCPSLHHVIALQHHHLAGERWGRERGEGRKGEEREVGRGEAKG
jgi:hypothetical protein